MHIVCYTPEPWSADALAGERHRVSCLTGPLVALASRVATASPDLVIVRGFAAGEVLIEQLEALVSLRPLAVVALVLPQADPELLLRLMQAGVREVLPSEEPATIFAAVQRAEARLGRSVPTRPEQAGRCLAFMSAKGGDGGTAVAANLAAALAREPDTRVLLIDLSLPFGDADMFLCSQTQASDLADICGEMERLDGALLGQMVTQVSDTLHLIPSPGRLDKLVRIQSAQVKQLLALALREYQFVLVDMGDGIDPVRLDLLEKLEHLFLVTSLSLSSLRRSGQLLLMLDGLEFSGAKVSLVGNRVGESQDIAQDEFEKAIGMALERQLPGDGAGLKESVARGVPLVSLRPKSALSRGIVDWANALLGKTTGKSSPWRLFAIK